MESVTNRTNLTSQAFCALSPWNDDKYLTSVILIKLGNNSNSKLEVVSALNSFNLAWDQYYFGGNNCVAKYNPKVYLGAIHSAAQYWDYDYQSPEEVDEKWVQAGLEKSGS